jgi:DMSO/TMAO reductase YedYZ molybdopterin-dependent catalytic subunit
MDQKQADEQSTVTVRHGVLAGIGAALVMTAAMAVLRYTTSTPSLPEILGEAIIGLMPAVVFSTILDVMQKAAKPTLYVGIFVGMLAVGGLLGRGFAFGALTWRRALTLGVVIWAAIGLVILPLLGAGLFGGNGLRTGLVALAIQLALVVGSFVCALLLLLRAFEPAVARPVLQQRRRTALVGLIGGLVALAVGGTAWRSLLGSNPVSTADLAPAPPPAPAADSAPAASTGPEGAAATTSADASAPAAAPAGPAAATEPNPGAVAAANPGAAATTPRGVPSINAPSVPMTILADKPAAAPFDVPKLSYEVFTPKEFYTVSKNLIDPSVDMAKWSLQIDGLVERPTTYLYSDMTSLPTYSDYYTLQCISNTVGGDLWGNAHWKGVRLVELLGRVGLKPGIRKVVFHADDGYTDSIALDAALRPDTLLAYEMNGEVLPKEHGYPARLLIPGIYGMKNVKWVTRIELVDYDFKGYWMQRGWDDAAPYQTSTRIDVPANRAQVGTGEAALGGVTFAGARGINKVEISLDDGKTWEDALMKPALSQNAWNLWVLRKSLAPGTYLVKARAVDGNNDVQTSEEADPLPAGATGYHSIVLRVG